MTSEHESAASANSAAACKRLISARRRPLVLTALLADIFALSAEQAVVYYMRW